MVDAVVAANTARAAAAEAGPGSAESIAVTCELLRLGIFFDGTGNSRNHAGRGEVSWHTNVDLLERKYEDTMGPQERRVGGVRRRVNYGSHYARGIGVEANGETTAWGMGTGQGEEGVRRRVEQTIDTLRVRVHRMARGMEVCDLHFDAFGFSRGAAAARHFANVLPTARLTVQGTSPEMQFLGLYDTVVMIGIGVATNGNDDNVRVGTRGVARRIVHITADDEIRENFPLTLAQGGTRIRMAGVHSDIGGGYNPNRAGDQRGTFAFEHEDYPGLPDYLRDNWGLTTSNGTGADRTSPDTLVSVRQSRWQVHDSGEWHSTFNWSCLHGLQFVSLRLMFDQARAFGVPLTDWTNSISGTDVSLSDLLDDYYDALRTRSASTTQHRQVRLRYSHISFHGRRTTGVRPHLPISTARRRVATL